jgi:rhodanese-related sulfurtransferase
VGLECLDVTIIPVYTHGALWNNRIDLSKEKQMKHCMSIIAGVFSVILVFSAFAAFAADVPQVTPEELKKLIDSNDKSIVVVDVQPKGVYDTGHVKGAINFPWAPDIKSPGGLPKDKTLILYCDCGEEEGDSGDTAQQLMSKFGYTKVKTLKGGWSKWQQLGYPIDKR